MKIIGSYLVRAEATDLRVAVAANATSCLRASAEPKASIVPQHAGDGARGGGGRREEGQSGAQRVPLLLLQSVAPDPERLPPVVAAVRPDRLPFGAQVVLELLELGRRRALQLHVVQLFQDEGGFFAIGREQGIERILGLVEVAQRLGPSSRRKISCHHPELRKYNSHYELLLNCNMTIL